jgi:methylmalonyl-CoA/ethylmalonyl-CoA epimerase
MTNDVSMIQNIGQVALTVTDTVKAVEFYRDKLNLKLLMQPGNMAFFDCGGVRLMVSPGERPADSYSSVIYFRVADIQISFATLAANGVPFEGDPHLIARLPDHDLWMAFFRDPARNLLALMSEVRPATS